MRAVAVVALLLAFPHLCAAQRDAAVARPEVKAGDRWTYRRVDYATGKQLAQFELQATFASAKAIHTVSVAGKDEESDATYTSEWNAVATGLGTIFSPHSGLLRFPLRIGDAYRSAFEVAQARRGPSALIKRERTARVVGWEDVVVPAGKFRALKVEADDVFERLDNRRRGTTREVVWYVPAVKRWVKLTYHSTNDRGRVEMTGEELVAFSVQ